MSATVLSSLTNTISGIKFQTINDIPNLQLWLDASDNNAIISEKFNDDIWIANNSSYLQTSQTIVLTGDFTLEGWIRKEQRSPQGYSILFMGDAAPVIGNCQFMIDNNWVGQPQIGQVGFVLNEGNYAVTTSTAPVSTNVWQHVAYIREGNNIRIYVDGISQPLTVTSSVSPSTTQARIRLINQWLLGGYGFIGGQSNFRIVNGKALYTSNFNPSVSATVPLQPISETNVTTPLLALQNSTVTVNNGNVPGITLTSSGTFTSITPKISLIPFWLDKSPNALTASIPIINNQPTYLSAEINGLNVLNFDGINHFLTLSTPITTNINYSQFFVFNRRQNNIVSTSLGTGTGSLRNYSFVWWDLDNRLYSYTLPTNQYRGTAAISASGTHISSIVQSIPRNTVDFYLDNGFRTISLAGISPNQNLTANEIGRSGSSGLSYLHNGNMGEIIQMAFEAPPYEINLINQKLFDKWKVPKQVPYLKTAPILSTGTSTSAISSTLGTWYIEPTSYQIEWIRSLDNVNFTTIINTLSSYTNPLAISVYNPTPSDYGYFIKTSVSATNSFGTGVL